jgi:UPF0755 protein
LVLKTDARRGPSRKPVKRRSAVVRVMRSLLILGAAGAVVGMAALFLGYTTLTSEGPLKAAKIFNVEQGMSRAEVGAALRNAGIVESEGVFTAAALLRGLTGDHLKPGEYEFTEKASIADVLATIVDGRALTHKISVPEGWTSAMAAARLTENPVLTGEITKMPPEGALLPDTYVFRRGMTRQKLLDEMVKAQSELLDRLWEARNPATILKSKEEAVALASIVEKETGIPEERPLVASVFVNRLKKGMRLQSDPTIIYGLVGGKGKLDRGLTRADIDGRTPYNTYVIDGLPPGPIANPGRASLEAVLNPPATDYLYFVADGSGGHAFAKTLEEHNANVRKWRALENEPVVSETTLAPADVAIDPLPAPSTPAPAVAVNVAAPALPETTASTSADVVAQPAPAPAEPVLDLKPGTWVRVADMMVPIPKQKPKK